MNHVDDFKEWLNEVRFSRNICMLIPMEAVMGYPVAVENGKEYIIPFFRGLSFMKTEILAPPFAYIRIQYPSATILTYNNLHTLPEWKYIDWSEIAEKKEGYTPFDIDQYYHVICNSDSAYPANEMQDELLIDCLRKQSVIGTETAPLVVWYIKLIEEAKKYR